MNENLAKYRTNGFDAVEGWCDTKLFDTINLMDQVDINKKGGCCEIGVHHGKLYILLNQVISKDETSYAVDVFDNQSLNIDNSGKGSLHAFKNNLSNYDAQRGANTSIIIGDSTDPALKLEETIGLGSLRFMSIDGGHTTEHTLNDLHLANKLIANEGVVILDDVMHYHWLGVIEGVTKFLSTYPTLVPFAIGHNKLYLSKLSFHRFYFDLFNNSPLMVTRAKFFGHDLVAI
jgi:hypothetical protein